MSYSRRQLEALGEPLGECVTRKEGGRVIYGGGGGGGGSSPAPAQPTSTTSYQTNIPEYAKPYMENVMGKAEALTDISKNPYQSYGGERNADFSQMQKQAFGNIAGMGPAEQIGQGTALAGGAGLGGLMAGQNYAQQATNPNAIQSYMSPYQQAVTDYQKSQALRDYQIAQPMRNAQATSKGAFGGTRQALVDAEAQRALNSQLQGITATGAQNAFQNAQQAQQFGANLGLQGLGMAGQNAATLGQLGQTQYGQQQGINQAQLQAGAQQQAMNQNKLNQQYQDWATQQNYPYKQLGFMSDILRGAGQLSTTAGQSMYQAPPTSLATLTSLGSLAGGIGSLAYGLNK
jgi:hypothetical protein